MCTRCAMSQASSNPQCVSSLVVSTQYKGFHCGKHLHYLTVTLKPDDGRDDVVIEYYEEGGINVPFCMRRRQFQPGDACIINECGDISAHTRNGQPVIHVRDCMTPGLSQLNRDNFTNMLQHDHPVGCRPDGEALCLPAARDQMNNRVYVWPHPLVYDAYWRMQIEARGVSNLNMDDATVKVAHATSVWLGLLWKSWHPYDGFRD